VQRMSGAVAEKVMVPRGKASSGRVRMARTIRRIAMNLTRRLGRPVSVWDVHIAIGRGDPYMAAAVEGAAIDYVRVSMSTTSRRELVRYVPVQRGVLKGIGGVGVSTRFWGVVGGGYGPGWAALIGE
jgi:hypothetical protein